MKVSILGAGAFGQALGKVLTDNQHQISYYDPQLFPDINLDAATYQADAVVIAIPSAFLGDFIAEYPDRLKKLPTVCATKGLLNANMFADFTQFSVISGPGFAQEIIDGKPSTMTASTPFAMGLLQNNQITIELHEDLAGILLCGSLKNIYAIAAGLCQGLDYGDNLNAVLTAAAMREMHNMLDHSMPCPDRNIYDNYYMGDLVVTCWSHHSRNRALGEAVARGERPEEVFARTGSVAEGYYSVKNLHQLACEYGTQHVVPIAEAVYRILYEGADPKSTVKHLIDTVF